MGKLFSFFAIIILQMNYWPVEICNLSETFGDSGKTGTMNLYKEYDE
jgi:hypothetical protein